MKLPSYEDLSGEQDAIYMMAPLDGATLVSGPPGTGKTVIAFYRAEALAKKGRTPRVVMYNNVLHRYASNASTTTAVRDGVATWWSWFPGWWRSVFNEGIPEVERWHPDWNRIVPQVLALHSSPAARGRALAQWGHLIVDEGQDFGKGFYQAAAVVLTLGVGSGGQGPALTVLADENQRLEAHLNACLAEIEHALALEAKRHYRLTRNYRNTYEIARVAAHFYCGLPGGIPALPEGRHGPMPRMLARKDTDACVEFIAQFVENQSDLEIGIFLPTKVLQRQYYNKLVHRLGSVRGIVIQRYTSGDRGHSADSLRFDAPGTVTVLCDKSCKGLEFDAVFIPELQRRRWDPASVDHMRMQLYVLSSRARTHLTFLYSGRKEAVPVLVNFPQPTSGLLEWG